MLAMADRWQRTARSATTVSTSTVPCASLCTGGHAAGGILQLWRPERGGCQPAGGDPSLPTECQHVLLLLAMAVGGLRTERTNEAAISLQVRRSSVPCCGVLTWLRGWLVAQLWLLAAVVHNAAQSLGNTSCSASAAPPGHHLTAPDMPVHNECHRSWTTPSLGTTP